MWRTPNLTKWWRYYGVVVLLVLGSIHNGADTVV